MRFVPLLRLVFPLCFLSTFSRFGVRQAMAWASSGSSNEDLVEKLKANGIIDHPRVEAAMMAVDRAKYCNSPYSAYDDAPQGIGYQATISAPHMHAHALGLLTEHLKEGSKALDVGSGSGYLTSCMALMVGSTGCVVGIEHIKELSESSREKIKSDQPELLSSNRILLVTGDGRKGYEEMSPYDAIHVGAAADGVPAALHRQLKPGGRMIVPVGREGGTQYLEQHDKMENGEMVVKRLMGVRYVPLTSKDRQVR